MEYGIEKALYGADLFMADNSKPTHRDSRTNTSDISNYIISSPVIFNNIQNLTLNNNLSSDHSAILLIFQQTSTNLLRFLSKSNCIMKLILLTHHSRNNWLFCRIRFSIFCLLITLILSTLLTIRPPFSRTLL